MDILAWARAFVEWFKTPVKLLITFAILSAVVLFLPSGYLPAPVSDWKTAHPVWPMGIFSFAAVFLSVAIVERLILGALERRRFKERLMRLTNDELRMLGRIIQPGASTIIVWPHEGGIGTLVADGILFQTESTLTNGQRVYGLSRRMAEYVAAHGHDLLNRLPAR